MLVAEIYGKVSASNPAHERMEDTLTSYVFSLFRYLNNLSLLAAFLQRARSLSGQYLSISNVILAEIFFWPIFRFEKAKFREPDGFLALELMDGRSISVVIEAKYDARLSNVAGVESNETVPESEGGKESSYEIEFGHQLADEFCGINCGEWIFREKYSGRDPKQILKESFKKNLLYITANFELPASDIREAIGIIGDTKRCKKATLECSRKARDHIFWVSWRDLYAVIEEMGLNQIPARGDKDYSFGEIRLISDLAELLDTRGLKFFSPFRKIESVEVYDSIFESSFFFSDVVGVGLYESILAHHEIS